LWRGETWRWCLHGRHHRFLDPTRYSSDGSYRPDTAIEPYYGGFKAQGRDTDSWSRDEADDRAVCAAGAFAFVFRGWL